MAGGAICTKNRSATTECCARRRLRLKQRTRANLYPCRQCIKGRNSLQNTMVVNGGVRRLSGKSLSSLDSPRIVIEVDVAIPSRAPENNPGIEWIVLVNRPI